MSNQALAVELELAVKDCELAFTRLSNLLERLPIRNDYLGLDYSKSDVATKIRVAKWFVVILQCGTNWKEKVVK